MELADGLADTRYREFVIPFVNRLVGTDSITIIPAAPRLFRAGCELYASRPDKGWSLTDCISFVVMDREGISEALTADKHFEQAGLVPLFG